MSETPKMGSTQPTTLKTTSKPDPILELLQEEKAKVNAEINRLDGERDIWEERLDRIWATISAYTDTQAEDH